MNRPDEMGIWGEEAWRWPEDPPGFVFIGRAAKQLGEHLFPEQWTGDEATSIGDPDALDAFDRWMVVLKTIGRACAAGSLKSAVRKFHGGPFVPLEDFHWNTERLWSRFSKGTMDLENPFEEPYVETSSFGYWIFFDRKGLDRLLNPLPRKQRGRPQGTASYRWKEFEERVDFELDKEGLIGTKHGWTQAELLDRLLSWTTDLNGGGWPDEPSSTEARKHMRAIIERRHKAAEKTKND